MDVSEFVKNFAEQFDETELDVFKPTTRFRDLEEWSSLTGLATLIMIDRAYRVKLVPDDLKKVETIQALFDLVQSKENV